MKIPGQGQDKGDFHDLGGLNLDESDIYPALRAHTDLAHHFHGHQQAKNQEIKRVGVAHPHLDIGHRHQDHEHKTNGEPDHLTRRPGIPFATRGRIQHGETDRRQNHEQEDQRPADLPQLLTKSKGTVIRGGTTEIHAKSSGSTSSETLSVSL